MNPPQPAVVDRSPAVSSVPPQGVLLPNGGYFIPGMQPGAILTPGGAVQYILPQVTNFPGWFTHLFLSYPHTFTLGIPHAHAKQSIYRALCRSAKWVTYKWFVSVWLHNYFRCLGASENPQHWLNRKLLTCISHLFALAY